MQRFLIRPHHMLCLQFFEGKGYSDEFITNMADIKNILDRENPYVEIVSGVDDLCVKCPNCIGENCKNEKNINTVYLFDRTNKRCYYLTNVII